MFLATASLANAAPRYRTCINNRYNLVKTQPTYSCGAAEEIAQRGMRVDGDDGVRVRVLGREWQCVTIARPDQGRHTLFGCFTPRAPAQPFEPSARDRAVVTVLLYVPAD